MVIEKLDALESALAKVLDELAVLRRSREELGAKLAQAHTEAQSAAGALREREEELGRLREENARLQSERNQVRDRVEKILAHIPAG